MIPRFLMAAVAVFLLTAAYQLGTETATAEWNAGSLGQIIGGTFAEGGPWIAFTAGGEAWSITPNAGWIRRPDFDLPVPSSEVKFLDSDGGLFILITTEDAPWQCMDNGLGWYPLDAFPGGPVALDRESWGKVKAEYRD